MMKYDVCIKLENNSEKIIELVFEFLKEELDLTCEIINKDENKFYIKNFEDIDLALGYDGTEDGVENYQLVQECVEIIVYEIIDNFDIFDCDYSLGGYYNVEIQLIL